MADKRMAVEKTDGGAEFFKALADETRLSILRQLYREDSYVELIASRLSLTPGTISHHLKKLEAAGLVQCSRNQFYMIYSINRAVLDQTIEHFLAVPEARGEADKEAEYRKKVIASFLVHGRIIKIPSQMKKREILWRYMIEENFEEGQGYTEAEVNEIILRYHDDYCTIRRDFVEMKLMTREHGVYRRF